MLQNNLIQELWRSFLETASQSWSWCNAADVFDGCLVKLSVSQIIMMQNLLLAAGGASIMNDAAISSKT